MPPLFIQIWIRATEERWGWARARFTRHRLYSLPHSIIISIIWSKQVSVNRANWSYSEKHLWWEIGLGATSLYTQNFHYNSRGKFFVPDKVTRSFNVRELTIPFSGDILEPIQYHGHQEIRKHLPKQKLLRILGATEIRNT